MICEHQSIKTIKPLRKTTPEKLKNAAADHGVGCKKFKVLNDVWHWWRAQKEHPIHPNIELFWCVFLCFYVQLKHYYCFFTIYRK